MKRVINTSLYLSCLNNINCITINKESKIFINHIEFCNVRQDLNFDFPVTGYVKSVDFLKLFNNDTYSTYAINGKKVDIKLSELKFEKILNNLNRFDTGFEIRNDDTIPSMSEDDLKKPIGMSYFKDYNWPKDKIIYSIEYTGDDKKTVVDYKNNEAIDDVCTFSKQKQSNTFRFEDVLYSLKDKFIKDSQKCNFPVDRASIKDIIIKTKSEEIKLENLYHQKYQILFLELVNKAIKDNTLEYAKIIFSTCEKLKSEDKPENKCKCCNK